MRWWGVEVAEKRGVGWTLMMTAPSHARVSPSSVAQRPSEPEINRLCTPRKTKSGNTNNSQVNECNAK